MPAHIQQDARPSHLGKAICVIDMDVRMTLLNLVNAALGSPTAAYTP